MKCDRNYVNSLVFFDQELIYDCELTLQNLLLQRIRFFSIKGEAVTFADIIVRSLLYVLNF